MKIALANRKKKMPKIIAHRGYTKDYPENTLDAFKAALNAGTDAVELDVHASKDGKLFVHHDYYLGDPDDGNGIITEQNSSYITSLHINNEHIPTLEQVFELIGDSLQYEVELKGYTIQFLKDVINTAKKYRLEDRIEFTSPHPFILTKLKTLNPALRTGYFVEPFPNWMDDNLGHTLAIANGLLGSVDVLHCPISMVDKQFIQEAHDNGLLVHAADCDTENDIRLALKVGVDQLSTNDLVTALKLRSD
jgi:glycerophosphoryl diester phosphodiesterase